ncbi:MAG: cytidylyltransferase domain-containing protein [Alphaproteobacteria bacterium]
MGELKIVASIEARMGSSRFPGKMMADVLGKPALVRVIDRLKACQSLGGIILATSIDSKDDTLEKCALEQGILCHRGSEDDVLARVVGAHEQAHSDIIVEVTGDSILLDIDVIDQGVSMFLENDCDIVSNASKTSFPQGADVQVFRTTDLKWVAENIQDEAVREHVSLYFYENPDKYRIIHLMSPLRWAAPDQRTQLDYYEDLDFINRVYEELEPRYGATNFGAREILGLLREKPEIRDINAHCTNKPVRIEDQKAS